MLLFCKAFTKRKKTKNKQIFRGHEGATYIFENYIDRISKKVENDFKIGHGAKKNIWDSIIEKIAEEMVKINDDRISEKKLNEIINKNHPLISTGRFKQALEKNMLLVRVPRNPVEKRNKGFDIKFPFQKFSDHLIGRYIFKKYEQEYGKSNKNLETAKKFFSKKRKLGKSLLKTWKSGIIETLSIQCPEQLSGVEFIEVAPYLIRQNNLSQITKKAFVESLIWRNPKAFSKNGENTLKIIKNIIRTKQGYYQLLNAFLTIAPIPDHPFNAERLHQYLLKFSMPKRDALWSRFLNNQYGEKEAVDRLLLWSWSNQNTSHLKDESIFLISIALSWFLTTPNRSVRDKATKGLVCILQNRINLIIKLLKIFKSVNELYIFERLFAVAYGCVLRNQEDKKNLKALAEWIYEKFFKNKRPPTHILLRDYARGIIEVALHRDIKLKIKESNINPPYKSLWPKHIPSEKILRNKYYPKDFLKQKSKDRGFLDIWMSVMYDFGTLGDFGRYVINSHLHEWTGKKIREKTTDRKRLFDNFLNSLSKKQKQLWDKTNPIIFKEDSSKESVITPSKLIIIKIAKGRKTERKLNFAKRKFSNALNTEQKKIFKKEIEPYLNHNQEIYDTSKEFDTRLAQRWIFNRTVKLGFNPKLHNEYDNMINRFNSGRSEKKPERIGKKYQWIAFHEFMALVSDHFEFKGDNESNRKENYKGPWQPYIRDIDTSLILQNDEHIKKSITFSQWKSSHGNYNKWEKKKSNKIWVAISDDLPNPKNVIIINDDKKREWLMLEGFINWEEQIPPEINKFDIPMREVWYMIKSYIVKKEDTKKFFDWAKKQNFMGRWMPESHDFYEIFLGEYPNSFAFKNLRGGNKIWTEFGRVKNCLPVPVIVTDDLYLNEFSLDCSYSGSISIKLLCKWLINEMDLQHKYLDGRFYNKKGNLIALTTKIFEKNIPSLLLIDKKELISFLNEHGYNIFWTLVGEKQSIKGFYSRRGFSGRLEINGAFTLNNKGTIIGRSHFK